MVFNDLLSVKLEKDRIKVIDALKLHFVWGVQLGRGSNN